MKTKKLLFIIVGAVILLSLLMIISIFVFKKDDEKKNEDGVNIKESLANEIELVKFENDAFTMNIPKGWKVNVGGADMFYAIRVYDPKKPNYQMFAILKAQPFLKNDKAKNWYESYYRSFGGAGNKLLAEAIVLYEPTVNAFYSSFNDYASFAKNNEPTYANFTFPDLKNFVAIEEFESNSSMKSVSKDDKTIRGTFQNKDGVDGEGFFMASLVDNGSYNLLGFDTMFYMTYNIMGITTDKDDFINYQELLTKSLNSLEYKSKFVNTTIENGKETTMNALAINKTINEAYNSYNKAWSNRQTTYDITSQKYSDATLGYDRVYDTETNDIYKAYNGFMDDYNGDRYKPVTDDMYTKAITGYIEK